MNGTFKVLVRFDCAGGGTASLTSQFGTEVTMLAISKVSNIQELSQRITGFFQCSLCSWCAKVGQGLQEFGSLKKESEMLIQLVKVRQGWIGLLAMFVSFFTLAPMVAPLLAQTTILG